jgi:hypothetical protein
MVSFTFMLRFCFFLMQFFCLRASSQRLEMRFVVFYSFLKTLQPIIYKIMKHSSISHTWKADTGNVRTNQGFCNKRNSKENGVSHSLLNAKIKLNANSHLAFSVSQLAPTGIKKIQIVTPIHGSLIGVGCRLLLAHISQHCVLFPGLCSSTDLSTTDKSLCLNTRRGRLDRETLEYPVCCSFRFFQFLVLPAVIFFLLGLSWQFFL